MKKIKVLQFTIANTYGGITNYVMNNWKWIDKKRFQFDFVTFSKNLDYAGELEKSGCKIYYMSCYPKENLDLFRKEFGKILEKGYDILHLNTSEWAGMEVEELAKEYRVPRVIIHSHNMAFGGGTQSGANILNITDRKQGMDIHEEIKSKLTLNTATDFWACSQEAADWLFGGQIPNDKIRIMKNAIEIEMFKYDAVKRKTMRKQNKIEGKYVIGNVARLCYQKNQEFLLRSFAKAYSENKNLRLLLVGDEGEIKNELQELADRLGIKDEVRFLGKRYDVRDWYQAFDLFVLPSRFEGMPIVSIEAQTSGVKCLLADTITREAKVTDNLEYLPLDEDVWAERMLQMADTYDESARKDMSEEVAMAGYDIKKQIKVIENEYMFGGTNK